MQRTRRKLQDIVIYSLDSMKHTERHVSK